MNPLKKALAYINAGIEKMLLLRLDYIMEENRILRRQLGTRLKLTDAERWSLAEKGQRLGKLLADTVTIVKPETLLRWYRELVARKFDGSKNRNYPGRPRIAPEIEELVLRFARENRGWGYDRIADAVNQVHPEASISDQTVANVLKRHAIAPSPERRRNSTWHEFISTHKECLWACDFFTAEVLSKRGRLVTYYVLFFIHLETRRVVLGGVTPSPDTEWMRVIARNITPGFDSDLAGMRYLIHDGDKKYPPFDAMLKGAGIHPLRLPPHSPNLNAFAERFVRTVKDECLNHLILFGERMLRHALREFFAHYHTERHHQGIGHVIPFPDERVSRKTGDVVKSERLGGLLNFYHRNAA